MAATPPSPDDPLAGLSPRYRERHGLVAVARRKGELRVAMANPRDPDVLETLRIATGCKIEPVALDAVNALAARPGPSLMERRGESRPALARSGKPLPTMIIAATAGAAMLGLVGLGIARHPAEAPPATRKVATPALPPAFIQAGFAATLTRLTRLRPPATALSALSQDDWGRGSVDLLTADPDKLRANLTKRGGLEGVTEVSQQADHAAGFRVTYRLNAALPLTAAQAHAVPLRAATRAQAAAAIDARGQVLARTSGATWQMLPVSGTNRDLLQLSIALSGSQAAVLGVADSLESGVVPARLVHWRLVPEAGGVKLEALLLVRWSTSPAAQPTVPVIASHPELARLPPLFGGSTLSSEPHPHLLGIAGRLPDDAEALVRIGPGKSQSFRLGGTVLGWTLVSIAADRVTFERAGERYEAVLKPPQ